MKTHSLIVLAAILAGIYLSTPVSAGAATLNLTCTPTVLDLAEAGDAGTIGCTVANTLGFAIAVNLTLTSTGKNIDTEDPLQNANPTPSACNGDVLGGKGNPTSCKFTFTFTPGGEKPEVGNDLPSDQTPEYTYNLLASASNNAKYNAPVVMLEVNVIDPCVKPQLKGGAPTLGTCSVTPEPSSSGLLLFASGSLAVVGALVRRLRVSGNRP